MKFTFSDIFVLQEVSTILIQSQEKYNSYLTEYLAKYQKDQILLQKQAKQDESKIIPITQRKKASMSEFMSIKVPQA
jgi:hypothetical protein